MTSPQEMLQGLTLLSFIDVQGILLSDVATALPGVLPLFFFRIPQPQAARASEPTSVLADLKAGMAYAFAWPGLRLLLCMAV